MNKTIKKLLEEALGIRPKDVRRRRAGFEKFLGMWSKSELSAFRKATEDLAAVNGEDWN